MTTLLRRLGSILLLAAATLALALGVALATGTLPYRLLAVQSGSMSPELPVKAAVLVHAEATYEPGDVLAFTVGSTVTTHRLVEVQTDGTLVTKGDAVEDLDPFPPMHDDVIGKVVGSVPELGYWLIYLQQPTGAASVLVGAIAIWLAFSVANDVGREPDEERTESEPTTGVDDPHRPAEDLQPA